MESNNLVWDRGRNFERKYCTIHWFSLQKEQKTIYNQTRKPQIRTVSVSPICSPRKGVRAKNRTAKMTA